MKHATSENHKKSIAAEKRNQRINSFMVKTPEESDKLIYAETKFAMFVAEVATNSERTRISVHFLESGFSFIRICGAGFEFGSASPNDLWTKSAL